MTSVERRGADEKAAVNPACPKGVMQWQHGHYLHLTNGSLATEPFGVDGRQLMSDPCNSDHGLYTHYRQPEMFNVRPKIAEYSNGRLTDILCRRDTKF